MKKFYGFIASIMVCLSFPAIAQNTFKGVYPIGDSPSIGYKTSMVPSKEQILFEANPTLRMAFYNNIQLHLQNSKKTGSTLYFDFRPQIRMYDDNSKPIKMPSYKIGLGYQQIIRHDDKNMFVWMLESGHYSNGQAKCAFNKDFDDESPECIALCNSVNDQSNLTEMLNRESGNFSTNYSELFLNYRFLPSIDGDNIPEREYSFSLGYTLYHNNLLFMAPLGGYSDTDIMIYGHHRLSAGAKYMQRFKGDCLFRKWELDRFSIAVNGEYIPDAHPWVKPLRAELTASIFFTNDFGLFISGIAGHDNYNYRFVDHGTQLFVGLTFDVFPPIQIRGAQ